MWIGPVTSSSDRWNNELQTSLIRQIKEKGQRKNNSQLGAPYPVSNMTVGV